MDIYTLKLTAQELQTIISGLGELPLKAALDTFLSVQRQANSQPKEDEVPSSVS